jgi:hypothetical protein
MAQIRLIGLHAGGCVVCGQLTDTIWGFRGGEERTIGVLVAIGVPLSRASEIVATVSRDGTTATANGTMVAFVCGG